MRNAGRKERRSVLICRSGQGLAEHDREFLECTRDCLAEKFNWKDDEKNASALEDG